ncbi:MAG: hypothetical protein LBI09_01540 [Nitrososphaerota archaeon]|nr:hypothetical protein [Nitrososphaerota archaeon]
MQLCLPLTCGSCRLLLFGVVPQKADAALTFLTQTGEGKDAQIIGEVTDAFKGVAMQTIVGGKRIIARPIGDPVPRIC